MSLIETVRPRAEYLRLFREVVINVWKEKEIEAGLLARTAEKQLGDLKAKRTALVEAFVYRQAVTQAIYNEEIARIEEEITVAQIEASEARIDHLDIEAVLGFAEHVIKQRRSFVGRVQPRPKSSFFSVCFSPKA